MTKVKDIFEEIFVGVNLSALSKKGEKQEAYVLQKEDIDSNSLLMKDIEYYKLDSLDFQRRNEGIIGIMLKGTDNAFAKLKTVKVPADLNKKFYLKPSDIIISIKKPYKAFAHYYTRKKVIVNSNYVVLRGIDKDKYDRWYVTYYLENVGISKLLDQNNFDRFNTELTKEDIKNIDLPDISLEEQKYLSSNIGSYQRDILKAKYRIEKLLKSMK